MDESESDDEGMFVMLGGDGRVFGTGDGLDYTFRAWKNFVPLPPPPSTDPPGVPQTAVTVDSLVRDSLLVDSPLMSGATFWLGADAVDAPRCALEELAAAIFTFHTSSCEPGEDFDPDTSGIEWWVQSRPSLKMHWDKDEELRISAGIFVHPHLSTVTYLTGRGGGGGGGGGDWDDGKTLQAPTVVFESLTVPTLARHGHSAPTDLPAAPTATAICASFPEVGKHIAFDGRLLHGVLRTMVPHVQSSSPAGGEAAAAAAATTTTTSAAAVAATAAAGRVVELSDAEEEKFKYKYVGGGKEVGGSGAGAKVARVVRTVGSDETRVTFLGNVWLNHRPKGVKPLPEGVLSSLHRPTSMPPASAAPTPIVIPEPKCGAPPSATVACDSEGGGGGGGGGGDGAEGWAETGCYFGWSGDDLKLSGRVPVGLMKAAGTQFDGAVVLSDAGDETVMMGTSTVRVVIPDGCDVRVIENDRGDHEELETDDGGNGSPEDGDRDTAAAEVEVTAKRQKMMG